MPSKYRRFFSRMVPETSGRFRDYSRKWLVIGIPLGFLTGLSAIVLNEVVIVLLFGGSSTSPYFPGYVLSLFDSSPAVAFLVPFAGLLVTGLILWRFASKPLLSGTEEVIEHYHSEEEGPMEVKEGLVKYVCAVFTVGLGGSSGLEGPSINAGAVVGSWFWRKFGTRLGMVRDDLRVVLLAGASAGLAAVFKAPLTGIVFAIEVPYKDDIAKKAFLPSIISGVTSYATFVSVEGSHPLFSFAAASGTFTLTDLILAAVLGVIVGLIGAWFSRFFNAVRKAMEYSKRHFLVRMVAGAAVVGGVALLADLLYKEPYTLGTGYALVQGSLAGTFTLEFLLVLLVLKMLATTFTLGSGGVGGIFIPLVVMGSLIGSFFAVLLHEDVAIFVSVGLAAFMAAGYKTPLAAVTFVGDTTGSVSYLIPAMIGAAVAYVVSGSSSVSAHQKLWEEPSGTASGGQPALPGDPHR